MAMVALDGIEKPVKLDVQRRIKQTLDPLNILNPNKIFQV